MKILGMVLVTLAAVFALVGCGGSNPCDDAVSHLTDCGFTVPATAADSCKNAANSAGDAEAACISDADCETLKADTAITAALGITPAASAATATAPTAAVQAKITTLNTCIQAAVTGAAGASGASGA